jgi:hypothetical protein
MHTINKCENLKKGTFFFVFILKIKIKVEFNFYHYTHSLEVSTKSGQESDSGPGGLSAHLRYANSYVEYNIRN